MTGYSPNLSLVTAVVEITLAIWALRGPGRRRIVFPAATILLSLAGYQLAEAWVCSARSVDLASRLAFADVVWLPPMGIWLILQLSGRVRSSLESVGHAFFVGAALLTGWVFVDTGAVDGAICRVVVATFQNPSRLYNLYGAFYLCGLTVMIFGATTAIVRMEDETLRAHLGDVLMGTLGFVLPSLATQTLLPWLNTSMPSVMCHYAAILAVFLGRMVAREQRHACAHGVEGRQQAHL